MGIKENLNKLKDVFPEIFVNEEFDYCKFHELIGYRKDSCFIWLDKLTTSNDTLTKSNYKLLSIENYTNGLPNSKNYLNTQNLYIEGDNFETLKLLKENYNSKIDFIYIDPPYNKNTDRFIYNDKWNKERKCHSNWFNMIYKRLLAAKELLSKNGVIMISIDETEQANLRKICDEVFTEENFCAQFIWTKTETPPSLSQKCRKTIEYILCYEKERSNNKYFGDFLENGDAPLLNRINPVKKLLFPKHCLNFSNKFSKIILAGTYEKCIIHNEINVNNGINTNSVEISAAFKWDQKMLEKELENDTVFYIKTNKMSIRYQRKVDLFKYKAPTSFINTSLNKSVGVGTNETAKKEMKTLGMEGIFDYPKPVTLIKKLIEMHCKFNKDAIILDFFSGSASTAHATMLLNSEDDGRRKFIMVQSKEACPVASDAYKAGYMNICEIGKERIRRAGEMIIKTSIYKDIDIGFKVLNLI